MNHERITQVADYIEENPNDFYMGFFIAERRSPDCHRLPLEVGSVTFGDITKHCGTTGCIAGTAIALFDPDRVEGDSTSTLSVARDLLGLTNDQAVDLFYDGFWGRHYQDLDSFSQLTPEQAVEGLRRIVSGAAVL